MKLEFIRGDSPEPALVRLFEFDAQQGLRLRAVFADLATSSAHCVDLHTEEFVEPIDECRLTLAVGGLDEGIVQIGESSTFNWLLTPGTPFTYSPTQGER